jgi:hypothetical protein
VGFYPDLRRASDIGPAVRRLATENLALFRRRGRVPDLVTAPVVYSRRKDGNYYANAEEILKRGWADCDGLTGWLLAQLWASGVPAEVAQSDQGGNLWHVFVRAKDRGRWVTLDPSVWKGMGQG